MAKAGRVVSSDAGTTVIRKRSPFPLRVKLLFILVIAIVPPAAALWTIGYISGDTTDEIAALCAALLGLGLGYFLGDVVFVEPVKALSRWLLAVRDPSTSGTVLFPAMPEDEIGALGREISSQSARMLRVAEESKNADAGKSVFLSIAAHQLRTPITDLTWSIEELLDPNIPEGSRTQRLEDLNRSLKRTLLVVNHILASANIEEGRFGYVMEMIDIVPLIEKLLAEFRSLADDRGITLTFDHGQVPLVYADAERISQALFDILSNAVDYTPQGGRVTITLKPAPDRVEVSVADTGIGIPERELPFLFTKFHRGENARHLRPNGSGLGLYLVKNILNAHGSDISVVSDGTIGGTVFTFSLKTQATS